MQKADRYYDPETLWWQVKRLSMLVAVDEEAYFEEIRARLSKLESIFKQRAEEAEREVTRWVEKYFDRNTDKRFKSLEILDIMEM